MIPLNSDAPPRAARLSGVALALLLAVSCGGSVKAGAKGSASASSEGDADADFSSSGDAAFDTVDESQSEEETSVSATPSTPQMSSGKPTTMALLGARHDVILAQGAPQPCACLAVAIGQPGSAQFSWTGNRPTVDPTTQTVIALGSSGVPCPEAGPGASYMGYAKERGDVIVTVEAAVAGRPVTHGAIIPKPDPGKQIFVQPSGKIPYGRGKGGEPRCALGSGQ